MGIADKVSSTIGKIRPEKEIKPVEVKVHRAPKTVRKYERVDHVVDFLRVIEKHGDKIAFSYFDKKRKVKDMSYTRLVRRVKRMAAALTEKGYAGKRIALIGDSSPNWVITYLAVLAIGGVVIPMDKELEIHVIEGFLENVDADGILYSASFNGKFNNAQENHKSLSLFIAIDPDEAEAEGRGVISYRQMMEIGKEAVEAGYKIPPVKDREAMCEMLFTSGTTGTSKCVMLSQKNIFSCVSSAAATVDVNPDDKTLSVLPLHHTYELACMLALLDYGAHVCINDSLTHVVKNLKIFKPNLLILVPLYVYTFYKRIWSEAKKSGRDKKLRLGIGMSRAMTTIGVDKRRELFKDVLDAFGGNLEKIICGGAALNPRMIEFFENLGVHIYEGFGITECSPLVFVTPYYARKYGSVGPSVPCCQARIDGEYLNDKGYYEGEIQVKGDNVMLGYYKNEDATADAFTADGWFRTGDVGYEDADGYFYITGRMKNVIVLENGKNVFPEEIEEYLEDVEAIAECAVIGRDEGEVVNLTALIYPDMTKYPEDTDIEDIQEDIEKQITAINKTLPTYKQVKIVELRSTPFEKTSSKKIKRHLLK